jgi:hypothetical protein
LAALTIVLVVTSAPALAQGLTGTVWGTVNDTDGRAVAAATVSLVSEARGLRVSRAVSDADGRFVLPQVPADVYTIQVEMPSFLTVKRTGLWIAPGSRIRLGTLTIGRGTGTAEVVVKAETPMVQAASGEKSFTIPRDWIDRLPVAGRRYGALLGQVPGVVIPLTSASATVSSRIGGGGETNFTFDGVTLVDPVDNRAVTRVGIDAIDAVAVAASAYQAEYGRSSGLQVTAVTRSGTNRFLGSVYDVERKSTWNANSRTNILNGDPKPFVDERDWGFSIGGPIGRAGGLKRLFFFVAEEFQPRRGGGEVVRFRLPTLLERQGDFSASTDNLGLPYRFIRDTTKPGGCNVNNSAGCFNADGVVGRIPADRLYAPGLALLNWYPLPNIQNVPGGQSFNYQAATPVTNLLGYQSVVRLDYLPRHELRGSFRFFAYDQPDATLPGTLPGWNDARADNSGVRMSAAAVHWTMSPAMVMEGVWGRSTHHQTGCSASASGPALCRAGLQISPMANRLSAGFGELPYLFPDATKLEPGTLAYQAIARAGSSIWDGARVQAAPSITWGGRVANSPPSNVGPFGDFLRDARASTLSVSVTRVMGRHTGKAGYYFFKSDQWRGAGNFLGQISFQNDGNNPLDTTFPFANAAIGVFTSYRQQSRWAEGTFTATSHEVYLQDTWKLRSNLTVDYGLRFVRQTPEHDANLHASNFFPGNWRAADAPFLYGTGCANGAATCNAGQRRARDPLTGQLLAANGNVAIGALVPNSGSATNGLVIPGQGIANAGSVYPALGVAPRAGVAWNVVGTPQLVIRGGGGLFFDRTFSLNLYNVVNNPPFVRTVTMRFGQLQTLGSSGLATETAPAVTAVQYRMPLPASTQWNAGVQVALPFDAMFDISYTGQHSYNVPLAVDLNRIDLGAAFDPQYADPTQAVPTPANSYVSVAPDLVRSYRGYSSIVQLQPVGWRTYHSIQVGLTRHLRHGLSFSINDTIQVSDHQNAPPRLQHNADGTVTIRDDQWLANELFTDNHPQRQVLHATFMWDLPDIKRTGAFGRSLGLVVNDWRVSGIWNGQSGLAYGVRYTYASGGGNVNLTGSPDYAARTVIIAAPGRGCSQDPLEQFDTFSYEGPLPGSVGLESGDGYLRGCFLSALDLSLARTIRLLGGRSIELRADVFNVLNQAGITNRNATMLLPNPTAPSTVLNRAVDGSGVIPSRAVPRGAGFGVANDYQPPRTVQLQVRVLF